MGHMFSFLKKEELLKKQKTKLHYKLKTLLIDTHAHTHKGIKSFPSCSLERKICVSYTHLNCGSHLIIMKWWSFYPRYATEICTFEFFKYTEVVKTLKAEVVYNEWS